MSLEIVLSSQQKDLLLALREGAPQLFRSYSNFEPIEIETKDENGNPYYIIPYKLLEDPDFKYFKAYVFSNLTTTIQIRILDPSEYKTYE